MIRTYSEYSVVIPLLIVKNETMRFNATETETSGHTSDLSICLSRGMPACTKFVTGKTKMNHHEIVLLYCTVPTKLRLHHCPIQAKTSNHQSPEWHVAHGRIVAVLYRVQTVIEGHEKCCFGRPTKEISCNHLLYAHFTSTMYMK